MCVSRLNNGPDHREKVVAQARRLTAASHNEPGVINYRVATDIENPNLLWFVEQCESADAVEVHAQTEHYEAFADAVMPELLAEKPEISQLKITANVD